MSSEISKVAKQFLQVLQNSNKKGTSAYDTVAEVTRVDGETVWVHIPGGVPETPVRRTLNASPGDKVQVRVSKGEAWLTGNMTAPPTDDKEAKKANANAENSRKVAKLAQKTAEEAIEATKNAEETMAETVLGINEDIEDIRSQLDGNITSWFYDVDPSLTAPPASDWSTAEKANHIGDLYYNTDTGYVWRWVYQNNAYAWVRLSDSDIEEALRAASAAQDTADSKRRVFFTTPTPPYDRGDLWAQGQNGDILRCNTAKASGASYAASDWIKASKYTDDTEANKAKGTATKFITDDTDGIMVHPEGDSTTGWKIKDTLELLKSGQSYIKAYLENSIAKVRVGLESAGHILIASGKISFMKGSTAQAEIYTESDGTAVIQFESANKQIRSDSNSYSGNRKIELITVKADGSASNRSAEISLRAKGYYGEGIIEVSDETIFMHSTNLVQIDACNRFLLCDENSNDIIAWDSSNPNTILLPKIDELVSVTTMAVSVEALAAGGHVSAKSITIPTGSRVS